MSNLYKSIFTLGLNYYVFNLLLKLLLKFTIIFLYSNSILVLSLSGARKSISEHKSILNLLSMELNYFVLIYS